jgi:hypothetical protein
MHDTLGHLQGPWPHRNRQEQFAYRVDRCPHPVARTLKALDGIAFTDLAGFEGMDHRIQLIELHLLDVQVTEEIGTEGLELLSGFHQPLQHGSRVDLEHPGRSADT